MNDDKPNSCQGCGATLPADAPQGLCPGCLLKRGLEESRDGLSGAAGAAVEPPAPADLAPHFPDLEILELVGCGGMGVVYKARQRRLNRLVALKILRPAVKRDPAFAERFVREAQALARLNHPNIVAVYDSGQRGDLFFFIMEFVEGVNLRQLLGNGRKLSPHEALAIVPQVCDALQYAHDQGVVHRDIKPENLLLDRRGRVKIADFGLAKILARDPASFTLTGTGEVMGTPQYMAPEQVEHPADVDHRADIYSLGVVFYQMLTGELPLGRFAPPSRKVAIDVRLDEVVLHALEKEPERRYQQVSEIKTRIETLEGKAGAKSASQEGAPAAAGKWEARASEPHPDLAGEPEAGPKAERRVDVERHNRAHLFSIPLVGVRGGRRVIHWPGVLQASLIMAGLYGLVLGVVLLVMVGAFNYRIGGTTFAIWLMTFVAIIMASGIRKSFKYPLERLTRLDAPPERGGAGQGAGRPGPTGTRHVAESAPVPAALPESGWGWLVGQMFGVTFTSPLAFRLANLSALGFLGFLGGAFFLAELPGMQWCRALAGLSGFFGLFGLAGVAFLVEFGARTRAGDNPAESGAVPRMSRLAVAGAVWVGVAAMAGLTVAGPVQPGLPLWQLLPGLMLTLVLLSAPVGVPVLGGLALVRIRCSGGRLQGLGLALFDVLLFPLLVWNGVVGMGCYWLCGWLASLVLPRNSGLGDLVTAGVGTGAGAVMAVIVVVVTNVFIIRRAWRAAKKPTGIVGGGAGARPPESATPQAPGEGAGVEKAARGQGALPDAGMTGVFSTLAFHAALLILLLAMVCVVLPKFQNIFSNFGTSLPWATARLFRIGEAFQRLWFLVIPACLGIDFGICLLLRLPGRRWLLAWALAGLVVTGLAVAGMTMVLFLPLQNTITTLPPESSGITSSPDNTATPGVMRKTRIEPFGAVIEWSLYDLDEGVTQQTLDLETGGQFDLPGDFGKRTNEQRINWVKDNGIDLLADFAKNRWALMTTDLRLVQLTQEQWDRITPAGLSEALAAKKPGVEILDRNGWRFYLLPAGMQPPATFAFQTAGGRQGVLQITGESLIPRSLKIRCKLAQSAVPAVPAVLPVLPGPAVTPPGGGDFVVFLPAEKVQVALDAGRDFVVARKWRLKGESGGAGGVTIEAEDPDGKRIAFTATPQAENMARLTVTAESGAQLSAGEIGAHLNLGSLVAATPRQSSRELSFGPLLERVVHDPDATSVDCFIDLDTGTLVTLPADPDLIFRAKNRLRLALNDEVRSWRAGQGADATAKVVLANGKVSQCGLAAVDLLIHRVDNEAWDTWTPAQVMNAPNLSQSSWRFIPDVVTMSTDGVFPATWSFRTRDGGTGLLQITGFTDNPRGVKIRYKLVRDAAATAATAPAPAAAPPAALKPVPPTALAALRDMKEFGPSFFTTHDMHDPKALAEYGKEMTVKRKRVDDELAGTVAEPPMRQLYALTAKMAEAARAQDTAAMDRVRQEIEATGAQVEKLAEEAAEAHSGDRGRERGP